MSVLAKPFDDTDRLGTTKCHAFENERLGSDAASEGRLPGRRARAKRGAAGASQAPSTSYSRTAVKEASPQSSTIHGVIKLLFIQPLVITVVVSVEVAVVVVVIWLAVVGEGAAEPRAKAEGAPTNRRQLWLQARGPLQTRRRRQEEVETRPRLRDELQDPNHPGHDAPLLNHWSAAATRDPTRGLRPHT